MEYVIEGELEQFRRSTTVPPPKQGGSRLYCPWEQREQISEGIAVTTCGWRKRVRSAHALKKYRRHYRRHHDDARS